MLLPTPPLLPVPSHFDQVVIRSIIHKKNCKFRQIFRSRNFICPQLRKLRELHNTGINTVIVREHITLQAYMQQHRKEREKLSKSQVECKICLKSAGFLVGFNWICVMLFEGSSPLKKCLNFDGLSRQETIGQHFPMYCSTIGHSYEALAYLFGQNIFICLHAANKNYSSADL